MVGQQLTIHDISDPREPVDLGAIDPLGDIHAPIANGDKLYVAAGFDGFVVMDDPTETPNAPTIHGTWRDPGGPNYSHHAGIFEVNGRTYALHNDEIGFEPWFKVIDVTPGSPEFLTVKSEYKTTNEQISHNVTMDGTTAYLAYYEHGIRVLDVADPTAPTELAYFHTFDLETASFSFDGTTDIAVDTQRNLVFAADGAYGLLILRRNSP